MSLKNSLFAVVMALLMVSLIFASCGNTLSGKYSHTEGTIIKTTTTYEFKGKNVTITSTMGDKELFNLEGTYEIKDDKIAFDFTGADETDDSLLEGVLDGLTEQVAFEKGDGYIKIGGVQYDKQ